MAKKSQSWFMTTPALYERIGTDLRRQFRTLRLVNDGTKASIKGALPIRASDGTELDRFQIEIELPEDFPKSVPIVRETGGRIPRIPDRHVNFDGTACLFVRDETWRFWGDDSTVTDFIQGPVYQFFLGQIYFETHQTWPFGERNHFARGVAEYYFEELGTRDLFVVRRFLSYLSAPAVDRNSICYCGSSSTLAKCHASKLLFLRGRIDRVIARDSLEQVTELVKQLPKPKKSRLALAWSFPLYPDTMTAQAIRRAISRQ